MAMHCTLYTDGNLIGALWDSVTNLLLHLAREAPKNKENQQK